MNVRSKKIILMSVYFVMLGCLNFLLKHVPTFTMRSLLMRLVGADIGKNVALHRGIKITSLRSRISIGKNTVINRGVLLDNRRDIIIGENVSISQEVCIYTLGHDIDSDFFSTKGDSVIIDDYVVIFSRAAIMPGIRIKKGAVVLPHSIVTKNVDMLDVVGGSPAVYKKKRKSKLLYNLSYRVWFGI